MLHWCEVTADICRVLPSLEWSIGTTEIFSQLVSLRSSPRKRVKIRKRPHSILSVDAAAYDLESLSLSSENEIAPPA
jgi:hypothetical protein